MSGNFHYISETSNKSKVKVFVITWGILIIFFGVIIAFNSTLDRLIFGVPELYNLKQYFIYEIKEVTPAGLFYAGFIGSLFFVPIPQEIFFYYSLLKGNPIFVSALTINAGFLLAQLVNYWCGSKLHRFFFHLISKRKLYKARRFITKHGSKGVFWFNLLPLPAPLLTFALGIARYNIYRLFFYTILGVIVKHVIIILFFLATQI